MNRDTLKGNWEQIRGEVKDTWGQLTNDEVDQIEGKFDKFVGTVQERYGYSRERAEKEIDQFLAQFNGDLTADELQEKAKEVTSMVREKASDMPSTVRETTEEYPWATAAIAVAVVILLLVLLRQGK